MAQSRDFSKMDLAQLSQLLFRALLIKNRPLSNKSRKEAERTWSEVGRSLAKFDDKWLLRYIRAMMEYDRENQDKQVLGPEDLHINGILAIRFLEVVVKSKQTDRFLGCLFSLFTGNQGDANLFEYIIRSFLGWMSCNEIFCSEVLDVCSKNKERENQIKLIIYAWYYLGSSINLVGIPTEFWIDGRCNVNLLVPRKWDIYAFQLVSCVEEIRNRFKKVQDELRDMIPDWELADVIWQVIKEDARCTLHQDGDEVTVNLPHLRTQIIETFTLWPGEPFPTAKVNLNGKLFGFDIGNTYPIENGRLVGLSSGNEGMDWYITMAVLKAFMLIVTRSIPGCSSVSGESSGISYERRMARPHFMKLQDGHRAHDEAIANAVKYFGRQPMPGWTFWAPKSDSPESVRVIRNVMTLSERDVEEFLPRDTIAV